MNNEPANARFEFTASTLTDAVAAVGIVAAPHGSVTLIADPDGRVTVTGSDDEETLTVRIDAVAAEGRLALSYEAFRLGLRGVEPSDARVSIEQLDAALALLVWDDRNFAIELFDDADSSAPDGSAAVPADAFAAALPSGFTDMSSVPDHADTCAIDIAPNVVSIAVRRDHSLAVTTLQAKTVSELEPVKLNLPLIVLARMAPLWQRETLTISWGWRVGGWPVVTLRCGEVLARMTGRADDRGLRAEVDRCGLEEFGWARVDRAALLAETRGIEQPKGALGFMPTQLVLGPRRVAAETSVVGDTSWSVPLDLPALRQALLSLTADQVELRLQHGAAERTLRLVVADAPGAPNDRHSRRVTS